MSSVRSGELSFAEIADNCRLIRRDDGRVNPDLLYELLGEKTKNVYILPYLHIDFGERLQKVYSYAYTVLSFWTMLFTVAAPKEAALEICFEEFVFAALFMMKDGIHIPNLNGTLFFLPH